MVGSNFTMANETPCADPHAGCCGEGGLDTRPYPISCLFDHVEIPLSLIELMRTNKPQTDFEGYPDL
jgi:hypothetical protein